jgi:hypothetical protein
MLERSPREAGATIANRMKSRGANIMLAVGTAQLTEKVKGFWEWTMASVRSVT